ncbi:hypothetical protein METBIDRAFT_79583 [Metschnikowia bicuspidata var. bicuspidata NRRL YB-4993]|uniref:Pore and endoplasmic reticulum protein of 33 kDa n=1 Tax=Metschnikowia bicuspidata var. bicuspidata NRRL YB-4993 TaxID=869754 RepID=A0A1A0H6N6_9ASCO|nr:hypothetical protein METBIDRAFT_79583 [Metschnikowia bicuspidata var. bicuspidata NRRL YB-4993]OBA19572.1 hypothetical protein METBIDRAFT_79583 [Metschnikowia bicuspidata var. bicuspidata NRRL YB-4993]
MERKTTPTPPIALVATTPLARSPQLYWFLGHAASIVCFISWQVFGFFSKKQAQRFSRLTLIFQLVSYGIVIRQSVSVPRANKLQLLRNENVQYFAFAAVLLLSSGQLSPWTKATMPFIVYSFFHSITYFQKHLLNQMPMSIHTQAAVSDRITYIASNFNLQALYFASLSEFMLISDIALGLPGLVFSVFRYPLYVLFFGLRSLAVLVFLKLRYDESTYSRQAVEQLDARVGAMLNSAMVPPQLRAIYYGPVRTSIARFAGMVLVPRITSQKKSQ